MRCWSSSDVRSLIALILIVFLIAPPSLRAGQTQTAAPQLLNIEVIEGEGAINNIRLRTARETIVEVQDENHKPVAGALVIFSLRGGNPFGRNVLQATTDSTGRVRANLTQLKSNAGRFEVKVKASTQGRTATRVIHQTNSQTGGTKADDASLTAVAAVGIAAVPAKAGLSALGILIIAAGVAGGVVGGLAGAGVFGGGKKTTTISVGAPHF